MVAFPKEAFGLLQRTGGEGASLAVGGKRASGGGGLPSAVGPCIASVDGPTPRELPLPQTPALVQPFSSKAEQEFAQGASKELWAASKASVLAGESGGGLTSAGPGSEELFLAPQEAIAEEVPVISPVQALPTVKPCAYVDIRIAMQADRALHVGASVSQRGVWLASTNRR